MQVEALATFVLRPATGIRVCLCVCAGPSRRAASVSSLPHGVYRQACSTTVYFGICVPDVPHPKHKLARGECSSQSQVQQHCLELHP